jgi:hypothetical protein
MPLSITKYVLLFWGIGAVITFAIAALAGAKPSIFGILTLPFWFLPALAGFGAHDNIMPLGLLGGSLFYGVLSFFVFRFVVRRGVAQKSK